MSVSCIAGSRHNVKADAVVVFLAEDEKSFKLESKKLSAELPHTAHESAAALAAASAASRAACLAVCRAASVASALKGHQ